MSINPFAKWTHLSQQYDAVPPMLALDGQRPLSKQELVRLQNEVQKPKRHLQQCS